MKNLRPYPAYKPTGLAWLPEVPREWEMLHVRELFTERREKVSDDEYEPLSVSRGGVVPQMESVAKSDDGDNRKRVCKGDFVINSRSDRKASSGVSPLDGSVSLVNIVLQPRENYIGSYVHYLLKSNDFVEEYYRNGRGIVADLWTTRYSEMKSISLPVPTKEEQAIIASYLDEKTAKIDRLIELKERAIKLLNEKKQAVVSKVVTRGLDPNAELVDSGVDWIGKVPRGWKVRRLRYLGGCANGISKDGTAFGRGNPFVSYGDVYKNFAIPTQVTGLVESSESEQILYSVKRGDVFFTRTSETIDELGTAATCLATISKATFAGFLIRFRPNDDSLIPEFSKYYFRSPTVTAYFRRTSGIVTRASLSQNLLKNLSVCIPPQVVQQKIVAYLDAEGAKTDKAIAAVTRQIGLLKEYRTRLISDAVTGRIDLRKAVA